MRSTGPTAWRAHWFWILAAVIAGVVFSPNASAQGAALETSTLNQIRVLQEEKLSRTPAQKKLDSQLVYALKNQRQKLISAGVTKLRSELKVETDGRVLVDIRAEVQPGMLEFIKKARGLVVNSYPRYQAIRAWLPVDALELLAALPQVRSIRPADQAMTNAGYGEGAIAHGADEARRLYGVDGTGIKIGVLSDGVTSLADSQASGRLPGVTILPGQVGNRGSEGTAMLEIVHDVAPGAELYFATAFNGVASFAQNIRDLQAAGCRIIVDDVNYFNEPPFQDGPISQAVNDVSAAGVLFFSCAANTGNLDQQTSGTWEGDFADGGPATLDRSGRVHNFGGVNYNTVVTGGGSRRVDLFWADPMGASANDYDVYVIDSSGSVVGKSTNIQDGSGDPYETIPTVDVGSRIVVVKHSGEGRYLYLSAGRGRLAIATSGATRGHNASGAPNAFSVAAARVSTPAAPFTTAARVEFFSADGPRRIFFNPDGTAITSGDFSSSGGRVLQKPDLTAADGVSTSVASFRTFFGTSAAAPHAAAIAALLWAYNPLLEPAEIRDYLQNTALDIEQPGVDRNAGKGLIMAQSAMAAAPRLFVEEVKLQDGNGNGSLDPNECADLVLTLRQGAASEPVTGITGTLKTTMPGIILDPAPRVFPDLAPNSSAASTTAFRISTTPLLNCVTNADFLLEVASANKKTFVLPFRLASRTNGVGTPRTFASTSVPAAIQDLSLLEAPLVVSGVSTPVLGVKVAVHLTHAYDYDLRLSLVAPDGTEVALSSNNGGSGQNYGASCDNPTVFADDAPASIATGTAPFAGAFKPEQSLSTFAGKVGNAVNGTWKLRVRDLVQFGEGTLQCWSLEVVQVGCFDGGGQCLGPPLITRGLSDQVVTNGNTVRFAVEAQGTGPLHYQWFHNQGTPLAGATNAVLELSNVSVAQAGSYTVLVSNPFGQDTSAASLVVIERPTITCAQNRTVAPGEPWDFEPPIATGTNVVIISITSTEPGCAAGYTATRTWIATDSGGFQAQCSQTILVRDDRVPVLTCAPDKTAPLGSVWSFDDPSVSVAGATGMVIYDNWAANLVAGFVPGVVEVGNEIIPGGTARYPKKFSFQYWATNTQQGVLQGAVNARVRFYSNDGPPLSSGLATPGTLLYESGLLPIQTAALGTVALESFQFGAQVPLTGVLPGTFTWTVQFSGMSPNDIVGLNLNSPPVVGEGRPQYWERGGGGWSLKGAAWSPIPGIPDQCELWPGQLQEQDNDFWAFGQQVLSQRIANNSPTPVTICRVRVKANSNFGGNATTTWSLRTAPNKGGSMIGGESRAVTIPSSVNWVDITWDNYPVIPAGTDAYLTWESSSYPNALWRGYTSSGTAYRDLTYCAFANTIPMSVSDLCFEIDAIPALGPAQFASRLEAVDRGVTVNVIDTKTNSVCSSIVPIVRTWQAVDDCGNTTTCSQTVTLLDNGPPVIVTQPQSQTVLAGETVLLSAEVSTCPPLSYQWYLDGTRVLAGETNPTLTLTSITPEQAGAYSLVVSNDHGSVTSTIAQLTVIAPAVILANPFDQTVIGGEDAQFTVSAGGSLPLHYSWYFEGSLVLDANGPVLALPQADLTKAGSYFVVVTNLYGSATSSPAALTVVVPAIITGGLSDQVITNGQTVRFSVQAGGTPPLSYQWFFNGNTPLTDVTGPELVLTNVSVAQAGSYSVKVSNNHGQQTSTAALMVIERPTITCVADRIVALDAQWDFDLPAATGTNVVITVVTTTTNATCGLGYTATRTWVARDSGGFVTHCSQTVTVLDERLPVIACAPDKTVTFGSAWDFDAPSALAAGALSSPAYDNMERGILAAFDPGAGEAGNEITLGRPAPFPKRFSFEYWGSNTVQSAFQGSVSAQVRFYRNDGPPLPSGPITPGTLLYDSGPLPIAATSRGTVALENFQAGAPMPFTSALPGAFTWTVQFNGLGPNDLAGLLLSGPQAVGQSRSDYWKRAGGGWVLNTALAAGAPGTLCEPWLGQSQVQENDFWAFEQQVLSQRIRNTSSKPVTVCKVRVRVNSNFGGTSAGTWSLRSEPNKTGSIFGQVSRVVSIPSGSTWVDVTWDSNPVVPAGADFYLTWESSEHPNALWRGFTSNGAAYLDSTYCAYANNIPLASSDLGFEIYSVSDFGPAQFAAHLDTTDRPVFYTVLGTTNLPTCANGFVATRTWQVADECGNATTCSQTVTVEDNGPAVIVSQPRELIIGEGAAGTLEVGASSCLPVTYQWFFNETTALPGANGPTLQLSSFSASQVGTYSVAVENPSGSVTSAPVQVTLGILPVVMNDPLNQLASKGDTVAFTVIAKGSPPLGYQWYFNETTLLSAETNATLTLDHVDESREGTYTLEVSNPFGAARSRPARLTVAVPATIVSQPIDQVVTNGDAAFISVAAQGSQPLLSQWFLNGVALAEGTNTTLVLSNVTPAAAGAYVVHLSNPYASVTSSPAVLTVVVPPFITGNPVDQVATNGDTVRFSVTAQGDAPLNYQWHFQDFPLSAEAGGPELVLENVSPAQAGDYKVIVSNSHGSTSSVPARLTVVSPPTILTGPADLVITNGGAATFQVKASGTEPLSYQWYHNGITALPDATNATLTLDPALVAQAGAYTVVVSNPYGTQSASASLVVLRILSISCPGDRTVGVSQAWEFGQPTATGTNVTITVVSTATNTACGTGYLATRTWVATDEGGSQLSCSQTVTVQDESPPVITLQPESQEVLAGTDPVLRLEAISCSELTYYWSHNSTPLGPAGANLVLSGVTPEQSGSYFAVVSNAFGTATSAAAQIFVGVPATIVHAPVDQVTTNGGAAHFHVSAVGTQPLAYQWLYNGAPMPGVTGPHLSLAVVTLRQAGAYSVVVSNKYHSVTSAPAHLILTAAPVIVEQPFDQVATNGGAVRFTVSTEGDPPISYQWYFQKTQALAGATAPALLLENITPAKSGGYSVVASNIFGMITSRVAQLSVVLPPTIRSNPLNQVVYDGDTAQFSVAAEGTAPLGYQWYFQGARLLLGATEPVLVLNNVSAEHHGAYHVVVTNPYGAAISAPAQLSRIAVPAILTAPVDQVVTNGDTAQFAVAAQGSEPLVYRWYHQTGGLVQVGNGPTLTLSQVGLPEAGSYLVTVSNPFGAVTSAPVQLTVMSRPQIVSQPQNQVAVRGGSATFTVVAAAHPAPSYQWFFGTTRQITGATNATLTIENVQDTDAGSYSVLVNNSLGAVISRNATLTLTEAPVITSQPQDQSVAAGSTVHLTVAAQGAAPLAYQWFLNCETPIPDATSPILTFTNVSPANNATFCVVITNSFGTVQSRAAVLRVVVKPEATTITRVGNLVEVTFSTVPGPLYSVYYNDRLAPDGWTELPKAVQRPGDGNPITVQDPRATVPERYYKIVVE